MSECCIVDLEVTEEVTELVELHEPDTALEVSEQVTELLVSPENVTELLAEETVIELLDVGGQGPVGPPGPPSPGQTLILHFDTPSLVWVGNHGLGQYPSITLVDSIGRQFYSSTEYNDSNTVTATHTSATSGKMFLN